MRGNARIGRAGPSPRPRGGEWLEDELVNWSRAGVNAVFSLLTPEEEQDLDLAAEPSQAKALGLRFLSFPIQDRRTPDSEAGLASALDELDNELTAGRNVVLHCRQGIGRTGLVAACLLIARGVGPEAAVRRLSAIRRVAVPETAEQRRWIDYASVFEHAR